MYYSFDKEVVKSAITEDDIFNLLEEWGGLPERRKGYIISKTICHNVAKEGSYKLYYYSNTQLFQCYTHCGSFDIFELTQKVFRLQYSEDIDLNEAVKYLAVRFNVLSDGEDTFQEEKEDWKIFSDYARADELMPQKYHADLEKYDVNILTRFNYNVIIQPWLDEGISQEALDFAQISYYPGDDQIVIPHFDIDGNLIGIRGRTVVQADAERFGKYRPLLIGRKFYSHPLGFNLYGLNWAKDNIHDIGKVVIFESEKSVLHYITDFGSENDIAVACCGSNLSMYQLQLLKDIGCKEVIIAFDRQWEQSGTEEQKLWDKKLLSIYNKIKNDMLVSFIYDKKQLTGYKDSPIDCGKEIFLQLFKERVFIR